MNNFSIKTILAVFCSVTVSTSVAAQYPKRISPEDSIAIAKSAAIADTARMIPGFQDLSSYDTPGFCLALMHSVESYIWRSGEKDTLPPEIGDSLPTAVREQGEKCLSKFTPETVPDFELYNYLLAAATLKDTTVMRRVINVVLNSSRYNTDYKIAFLSDAAKLDISKTHMAPFTLYLMEDLKKYGAKTATVVAGLYEKIRGYHLQNGFDTLAAFAVTKQKYDYMSALPKDSLPPPGKEFLAEDFYKDTLFSIWLNMPDNYAEEVARLVDLSTESSKDDMLTMLIREKERLKASLIDKPPSEMDLIAAFPSTATAEPVKGKVTIYYRMLHVNSRTNTLSGILAKFLRLQNKYGLDKLEIVIVTGNQGHMWDSPPLQPMDEAKLQDWYFRSYHQLPFTILANHRAVSKMRDGRLIRSKIPFDEFLSGSIRNIGYMVGKDGLLRAFDQIMGPDWLVSKYIDRELAR